MNRHVVVRTIERADPSVIDGLAAAGSATVHEAIGRRGFVGADVRPIQSGARLAGSAVTVLCHAGDNLMIHAAVECCRPGDVVVVTTTSPSSHGMFGELLATSLMARGVDALVIGAGVRDVAELRSMEFKVWTRHVSCEGTVKATPGSVNVPVVLGEVLVEPGDVVVADDDGVVIVPRAEAQWALDQCRSREANEQSSRERYRAGDLSLDVNQLRPLLERLGVVYVDRDART